jgi:tRNA (guanine37-N1)-methyltransferase
MRFDILTIFPEIFDSYFNTSILKRAQKKKLIQIHAHNLRKWTSDRHQVTDDCPYGGGMGMIFKVGPIFKAVNNLKKKKIKKCRVILFSAKGKKLTQKKAKLLSKYDQIILICPRYEGVDERVAKYIADEEICIGEYILTGGELPAMILVDAVSRFVPGVIKKESLLEESFNARFDGKGEYPQYTRPEVFYPNVRNKKISWRVPKILLSGHHKKINEWKSKNLKKI